MAVKLPSQCILNFYIKITHYAKYHNKFLTVLLATFPTGLIFAKQSKQGVATLCFDQTTHILNILILNGFTCIPCNRAHFVRQLKQGVAILFQPKLHIVLTTHWNTGLLHAGTKWWQIYIIKFWTKFLHLQSVFRKIRLDNRLVSLLGLASPLMWEILDLPCKGESLALRLTQCHVDFFITLP